MNDLVLQSIIHMPWWFWVWEIGVAWVMFKMFKGAKQPAPKKEQS